MENYSRSQVEAAATKLLARWRDDPVRFFREVLGMTVWSAQIEVAEAIRDHDRVAVRSGQKTGKSTILAAIALWWALTRKRTDVYFTAPSFDLISDAIWPEMTRLFNGAKFPIAAPEALALDPGTGLRLPNGNTVKARTTSVSAPQRLAGRSGADLLVMVDEASEFPEQLWEPILGNMAGGGRVLATTNPTRDSGTLFDAFHAKSQFWKRIHIRSTDNPNVIEGRQVIKGLALREWCEQMREEWGEDSAFYQVRVLGNFPSQGTDTIMSLAMVEAAQERWRAEMRDAPNVAAGSILRLGVDVARFGDDDSCVACARGNAAWLDERVNGFDGNAVAGLVRRVLKRRRMPGERAIVNVDETGNGSAVVDALRRMNEEHELGDFVSVFGVTVEENADNEEEYHRRRDELWFSCKEWLKTGALEKNDMLTRDLTTPKYGFDARGRLQVEQKEKMKRRLRRSPDAGDALCLAVYTGAGRVEKPTGNVEPMSRWEGFEDEGKGY